MVDLDIEIMLSYIGTKLYFFDQLYFLSLGSGLFFELIFVLAEIHKPADRRVGVRCDLDQVNALIAMYLMVGPAGAVWSVDRWLAKRRGEESEPQPSVGANIAIRLMQLHMCVIYLFGGVGKMRAPMIGKNIWRLCKVYGRLIGYPELKPHDLRHGVAMEVLEQHHDLEQVRALLGHARIDTTQIYTSIRPPQLKRAVSFYEEQATRMLVERNETRTTISVANGRARNR